MKLAVATVAAVLLSGLAEAALPETPSASADAGTRESRRQPSFLYVLVDDLGFGDVGYTKGFERFYTPYLNALARNGVVLERHYNHAVCTPSRAALLTGRRPHRIGVDGSTFALPLDVPMLGEELQKLGYKTYMAGKWHLGGTQAPEYMPTNRGFDEYFGILGASADPNMYFSQYGYLNAPYYWLMENEEPALKDGTYYNEHSTDLYVGRMLETIKEHPRDQPFFGYLALQMVHAPLRITERFNKTRSALESSVRQVDYSIGTMVQELERLGLMDNLAVIVTSDNGGQITRGGRGSNLPLRGGKWMHHEGGIRSPAIVYSPLLNSTRGERLQELVAIEDWYKTFIELGGGTVPREDTDGFNIWETVAHGAPSPRKRFVSIMDVASGRSDRRQVLLEGHQKLMRNVPVLGGRSCLLPEPGAPRIPRCFYNLLDDPNEIRPIEVNTTRSRAILAAMNEFLDKEDGLIPAETVVLQHPDCVARRMLEPREVVPGLPAPVPRCPLSINAPATSDPIVRIDEEIANMTFVVPCVDGQDIRDKAACHESENVFRNAEQPRREARTVSIEMDINDWRGLAEEADPTFKVRGILYVRGASAGIKVEVETRFRAVLEFETTASLSDLLFCRTRVIGPRGVRNDQMVCFVAGMR